MGKSVSSISPPKESHQFKLNYQNMRYSSDWKLFPNHFFHRKSIVVLSAAKLIGAKRNIGRREYFKIPPPLDRCYFDKSQLLCKPIQIYVIWIRAILKKEFKNYVRLYAIKTVRFELLVFLLLCKMSALLESTIC